MTRKYTKRKMFEYNKASTFLTKKDERFLAKLFDEINSYMPSDSTYAHEHLELIELLVKARPKFELTSDKDKKKVARWTYICGYYSAIQEMNRRARAKRAIREFVDDKTKQLNQPHHPQRHSL